MTRAIRKFGADNFIVEQIDRADSQEELSQKEHDYIVKYNSIEQGYNDTSALNKCGGNTYLSKTPEELRVIGEKIKKTKIGSNNPNATPAKCKNQQTGEEFHFGSQSEMQAFFNTSNHVFISRRCLGQIKSLYQGIWTITYEDSDYNPKYTPYKHSNRAKAIMVTDLKTQENKFFSKLCCG